MSMQTHTGEAVANHHAFRVLAQKSLDYLVDMCFCFLSFSFSLSFFCFHAPFVSDLYLAFCRHTDNWQFCLSHLPSFSPPRLFSVDSPLLPHMLAEALLSVMIGCWCFGGFPQSWKWCLVSVGAMERIRDTHAVIWLSPCLQCTLPTVEQRRAFPQSPDGYPFYVFPFDLGDFIQESAAIFCRQPDRMLNLISAFHNLKGR